jgi:intracellular septation protein
MARPVCGAASKETHMQLVKLLLDLGPLVAFFFVFATGGDGRYDALLPLMLSGKANPFFPATAVFMATTLISLAGTYATFRKVAVMPLITAILVFVFGGLTLYLADETFLKMKPTFVYLLFATLLAGGMAIGRPFLRMLFDEAFQLSSEGWRLLTWRWTFFFIFLALLNELVWRSFPTDIWVKLKVFGFLPLTMLFAVAQMGLIQKYRSDDD